MGTTKETEKGTNNVTKSPVKLEDEEESFKTAVPERCIHVWTAGQFSRLLDPGEDLYSLEGCNG